MIFGKFKKLIRSQISSNKKALQRAIYSEFLPEHPLHDDLYLVAFPKSGITWLSVLMANMHLKCSGLNVKASYYNIRDFVPDIHQTRALKTHILKFPGFRVIKSHSGYNPFYTKIIYLIRDPRDVMVSYYHFRKNLGLFDGNISDLIESGSFGINAWCRHVEGWFERTRTSQFINFVRYEDLHADPKDVIKRLYKLFGFHLSEDIFDYAVKNSTFSEMRKTEEYYSMSNLTLNPDFRFQRKGITGGFKVELAENESSLITAKANKWMRIFGYDK